MTIEKLADELDCFIQVDTINLKIRLYKEKRKFFFRKTKELIGWIHFVPIDKYHEFKILEIIIYNNLDKTLELTNKYNGTIVKEG